MKILIHISFLLVLIIGLDVGESFAQLKSLDASLFEVSFNTNEIEFLNTELVSNPIKVINKSTQNVTVYLEVGAPPAWKTLGSTKKSYTIAAGDTSYIPVRLLPNAKVEGNTKYAINAILRDEDGFALGFGSFYCFTKKIVQWEMSILPEDRIYLKNGESEGNFQVSMLNVGNYKDEFQLSIKGSEREDVLLTDTLGNLINQPTYTLALDAGEDTTLSFKVKPASIKRNFRTVSMSSHLPETETDERRFRLYAISQEAKNLDKNIPKRGAKVDFISLANETTMSPYGSDYFPLVAEAQIQNILSDYSFMSINLRGIKQFEGDRRLIYFTQLLYSQNYFSTNFAQNLPWYLGYFEKNWDVQLGLVSGHGIGLPSSGKGISSSYTINNQHKIGAHFTRSPSMFGPSRILSAGVYHEFTGSKIRVTSNFTRNQDSLINANTNVLSSRASFRLSMNHNMSVFFAGSNTNYTDTNVNRLGLTTGITYSGNMLNNKLRATINTRYSSRTFGISNSERFNGNSRVSFDLNNKWQLQGLNNLNINNRFLSQFSDTVLNRFMTSTNRLNLVARADKGTLQAGIFYDINSQTNYNNHYRGLAFNYSKFDFSKNMLYNGSIKFGYNRPQNMPEISEYFTAQVALLMRIKTLTFNFRYFYGPSNPQVLITNVTSTYPQQFRASVQYQYLFKNTHFVLQTGGNYTFNNLINGHSVSLFPEFFYFTNDGWRLSVNASYTLTSSNFQKATSSLNVIRNLENQNIGPTVSNTMRFGATIRKEFGVPVPFSKSKNYDLDFVAFYDLNGNGMHDRDEPTIENVVLTLKDKQVITNLRGEAKMKNVPNGYYGIGVLPLNSINGWFPEMEDSLFIGGHQTVYIPFMRGVKVSGKVMIDLDQRTRSDDDVFDLSNIKVTAVNGKAYNTLTSLDGSFEFYLPNGTYTISLDENILTSKYQLMQNNLEITLSRDLENMFITFFIVEKRRTLNIKKF
ncbi:MAG: hypothetical protein NWR83_11525, partial [Salibacteraceae bacterium]|nr:hypothetical protein [Salibacteraceae bacterium]